MAIDLRSDTVTRPTAAMLAAMASADTGDDVYDEDPTVHELEERVAGLLGHEAALFTVSGSLANMLGVRTHVQPGQEVICEARAHIVRAESGAHAAMHGLTTRTWSHRRGHVDLAAIRELLAPDAGPYLVSTAAVSVENTHNFGGGTIQPWESLQALRELVQPHGVKLHLDGARLWNAHVATGTGLEQCGRLFDTVSVCLSKGLGAPIGSVLAGSAGAVAEARERRKRLGAGWRQAGVLAAAGLYALDHHLERMAEDHANARALAAALEESGTVSAADVETNIIVLDLSEHRLSAPELAVAARDEGVLLGALGPAMARMITHLDVSADDCRKAGEILARILT
ncbi:MAG TPA: GntG family PLP-dependent aldolase [Jiangellaceae bacterium]